MGVLHAELVLVEVVVGAGVRAAAGGADDVLERLAHGDVLAADLVVLRAEEAVVGALVLRLRSRRRQAKPKLEATHMEGINLA